ncbi:MAG: hypothetical protein QMD76_03480 [Anaerosomatales bacterium]|nr:hypothetical protein [Anaerosomatales bacterium]
MRRTKIFAALVAAVALAFLASAPAWAGQGGSVGGGAGSQQHEARSGWDVAPPAEDAQLDRDRDCVQDRTQDGSCLECPGMPLQTRTRKGAQAGSAADDAAETADVSASVETPIRAQVRERVRIENLTRVENRLRVLDRVCGGDGSTAGLVNVTLKLAERLRAWLGTL